jgi:transposase/FtsZ-binding cell division protein ZapB
MTYLDSSYQQTHNTLQQINHRLAEENRRLLEENQKLQEENNNLREENEDLKQTIKTLQQRLLAYENPNTPPSRRIIHPKPQRLPGTTRYPGRPMGHRGVTRRKPAPDIVLEPPRRTRCTCGASLGMPHSVCSRTVEETCNPAPRQVIEYLEYTYDCPTCGEHISSTHPDCPPAGRLGKNALIQATLLRYRDRLPLRKTSETLERSYGLTVSPATVLDATRRVATWLRPEYTCIQNRIRGSPFVYIDETGLRVDGVNHWVWCFTTDHETLFVVRRSRGKRVLREVLGRDCGGVIICDGWRSYSNYSGHLQRCWAHLLREAGYLAEHVEEARIIDDGLCRLYARICVWSVDKPPPDMAERLVMEAKQEVLRLTGGSFVDMRVARFAGKVRNGLPHWFTFLGVSGVEPTNNRAERMLREVVVQRKIIGCLRTEKGTMINETLMTLLASWCQRGLPLPETLGDALTREWTKS